MAGVRYLLLAFGAATAADNRELKAELTKLAADHAEFGRTLQARVAMLGGKPSESGEAIGTVHRSFTAVRELVQNDSVAAAGEVYRGESYLIDELTAALKQDLTAPSRSIATS